MPHIYTWLQPLYTFLQPQYTSLRHYNHCTPPFPTCIAIAPICLAPLNCCSSCTLHTQKLPYASLLYIATAPVHLRSAATCLPSIHHFSPLHIFLQPYTLPSVHHFSHCTPPIHTLLQPHTPPFCTSLQSLIHRTSIYCFNTYLHHFSPCMGLNFEHFPRFSPMTKLSMVLSSLSPVLVC